MLITLCTIRQLPQAFALADSFLTHSTHAGSESVLIGLADDPVRLPSDFVSPYPLLPIGELLPSDELAALSAVYTPTEFVAACKPLFIAEVFRRYPAIDQLIYADPNVYFLRDLTPVWQQLAPANALMTPFLTQSLTGQAWPDEKFFQNIGLYSSDFLAFRRCAETDRLLTWWDDRVRTRARIDFCAGLCTDQLWLMHVPVFFRDVVVVRHPGWHVGPWNLPQRRLRPGDGSWWVTERDGPDQAVQFVNFKGLLNPDEGFFPHHNRLRLTERPDVTALLTDYRRALSKHQTPAVGRVAPAYGHQPEPVVLRGWRRATVRSMRAVTRFFDRVRLPALR